MNLNADEKRIQQLFREMSLDDQRRAPELADVLAKTRKARWQNDARSLRFSMAVAMLCAALLIAMAMILRPTKPQGAGARDDLASTPVVQPESQPSVVTSQPRKEAPGVERRRVAAKPARHRRRSSDMEIALRSLTAWRSPTASLMQTPDDELLRSLPRLGESLLTIKSFSLDQFN